MSFRTGRRREEKCDGEGTEGSEPRLAIGCSITPISGGREETHLAGEASPAAAEARRRCASPRSVGRIARAASLARAPRADASRVNRSLRKIFPPTVRVAPSATPSPRARAPADDRALTRSADATLSHDARGAGATMASASSAGRARSTRRTRLPSGERSLREPPSCAGGKNARRRTGARDGLPRAVGPFGWSLTLGKDVRHSLERTDRRGRAPAPSICRST